MLFKKFVAGLSIAFAACVWTAAGCSGDNGGGDDGGGPSDGSIDHKVDARKDGPSSSSSSSSGGDSGDDGGGPTCSQGVPFMAEPWVPPMKIPGACTMTQEAALVTAFPDNNMFSAWLMDPANATCAACAVPNAFDGGASKAGAVLIYNLGGGNAVRAPNFGGCVALFDGMGATGACGEKLEDWNICLFAECGMCSDYAMPKMGGPFAQCETAVDNDATMCKPFVPSMSCFSEIQSGPGMVCNMFSAAMVDVFCGGSAPDGGGDASDSGGGDAVSDAPSDGAGD